MFNFISDINLIGILISFNEQQNHKNTLYKQKGLALNLYLVASILFDIIIILKTYANRSAKNELETK